MSERERVRTSVLIDREVVDRLQDIGIAEDRPVSSVIRRVLAAGLEHEAGGAQEAKS